MKAEYKKHAVKKFNDNPLTESIHVFIEESELLKTVTETMQVDRFWALSPLYQSAILQDLSMTHIPVPLFYDLYMKFAGAMLHGYSGRNPLDSDNVKFKHNLAIDFKNKTFGHNRASKRTTAASIVASGVSGTGKTTTIRRVLECIPQLIEHDNFKGTTYHQHQVTWLSFDLPSTPSIKALVLNFFQALDKVLGDTSYHESWIAKNRQSVDAHLHAMTMAANNYEIGLVHIDEVQFMLNYGKGANAPSLQGIEALFNKIGIPIVLSTTPQGLEVFKDQYGNIESLEPSITTVRRMLSDRHFTIDLIKSGHPHYLELFNALFPSSLVHPGMIIDNEFKDTFHFLTCGLRALMTRLAQLFHEYVVKFVRKKKPLPGALLLLKSIFHDQFSLISPALVHLRANNVKAYEASIKALEIESIANTNAEQIKHKKQRGKARLGKVPPVLKGGRFDQISVSVSQEIAHNNANGDEEPEVAI
jgi:hypothetical protein